MKPCQVIGLNSVSDNEKIKDTFKTKGDKNQAALQGLMTTRSNDSKMNSMKNSTTTTTAVCVSMHMYAHTHDYECMCPCTCEFKQGKEEEFGQ